MWGGQHYNTTDGRVSPGVPKVELIDVSVLNGLDIQETETVLSPASSKTTTNTARNNKKQHIVPRRLQFATWIGNAAHDHKKQCIVPRHLLLAIQLAMLLMTVPHL